MLGGWVWESGWCAGPGGSRGWRGGGRGDGSVLAVLAVLIVSDRTQRALNGQLSETNTRLTSETKPKKKALTRQLEEATASNTPWSRWRQGQCALYGRHIDEAYRALQSNDLEHADTILNSTDSTPAEAGNGTISVTLPAAKCYPS